MTTSQRLALSSPPNGSIVYDTDDDAYFGYVGGEWAEVGGGSGGGPHTHALTDLEGSTEAGRALLDDADAAAQRSTLGLGTAATQAVGAFDAAGSAAAAYASAASDLSTHEADTTTHGISAFGATLVDDADAATARATLGIVASGPSLVKKTSDQTFNSTTPADVSSLSFAVTSGRYYEFRFLVLFRSDTATVGIGLAVTAPNVTRFGYTVRAIIAADGAGAELQGAGTSSGDAVLGTAVPATNTDYIAEVVGVIVPSANGTIQLRARTETGTTVVTVRQGSVGYLWDHGT